MTSPARVRSSKPAALFGAYVAELVGTFMFVFAGTATVLAVKNLAHSTSPTFTAVDDIAISLAFGLALLAAVYLVATVSGAHLNPAVTIGLAVNGEFPWREVVPYLVFQFGGGLCAALMDWFMFGDALRKGLILGTTHPGTGVPWWRATLTEFVITAILMLVIMSTAVYKRAPGGGATSGLAIGLWVTAAIFLALPISGGSLNPARTIGPDIVAWRFPDWWVYFLGPIVGAVFGAGLWKFVLAKGREEAVENVGTGGDPAQVEQREAA
ncbi:MAG TPA: MIP/aquaporin family protein [Mycobacteriales bacterium]